MDHPRPESIMWTLLKDEDMNNTVKCLREMAEAQKLKPKLGEKFELNQASEAHIRTIENKGCLGKKYFEFSHWTDDHCEFLIKHDYQALKDSLIDFIQWPEVPKNTLLDFEMSKTT